MTPDSGSDTTAAWHAVGPADAPPDGTLRTVVVDGRPVCIARVEGRWVAFDDTCTHEECALADGELDGRVITCPCHGSEFDVLSGDVLCPPALDPLPVHSVRVVGAQLELRLGQAGEAPAGDGAPPTRPLPGAAVAGPDTSGLALDDVDLTDLDVWERGVPHDWLALLRRVAPLHWQEERDGRGFWAFTRYDDIVAVSKDYGTYSSETGGTSLEDLDPDQVEARKSMLDTDPPAHTRLRALVNQGFTPRVLRAYEDSIRAIARRVLDDALAQRDFDWVEAVASEIPMVVFSRIMGLPLEDRRLLIELGDKLLGNTDPDVVGAENLHDRTRLDPSTRLLPFSSPFALDLIEYGRRLGEARRAEPREDITTRLVQAEVDGSRLDEREFGVFFILLTTAGNETTRHSISLGLADLLAHPEQAARLTADPGLAGTAADEILRRAHPVHHFRRTATRDVTVHGRRIRAGDKVTIWYAAGNFDEQRFRDPYALDVGREPNRHLTFGLGGPHFCLGAHLARLEIRIWLEEMSPHLDRLELSAPPTRLRSNFFNGVKRMPVRVLGAGATRS